MTCITMRNIDPNKHFVLIVYVVIHLWHRVPINFTVLLQIFEGIKAKNIISPFINQLSFFLIYCRELSYFRVILSDF